MMCKTHTKDNLVFLLLNSTHSTLSVRLCVLEPNQPWFWLKVNLDSYTLSIQLHNMNWWEYITPVGVSPPWGALWGTQGKPKEEFLEGGLPRRNPGSHAIIRHNEM